MLPICVLVFVPLIPGADLEFVKAGRNVGPWIIHTSQFNWNLHLQYELCHIIASSQNSLHVSVRTSNMEYDLSWDNKCIWNQKVLVKDRTDDSSKQCYITCIPSGPRFCKPWPSWPLLNPPLDDTEFKYSTWVWF